ncbi:MAG TPA: hypothetical protein VK459_20995, partial [Polyangiaceae bacterium]|nr:hypothetical protein [Polyangiaceae bacterium]
MIFYSIQLNLNQVIETTMRSLSLLSRRRGLFIAGAAVIAGSVAACSGSDDGGVTAGGCPDDLAYFEANIWEPILSKKCAVCHSSDGLAKT